MRLFISSTLKFLQVNLVRKPEFDLLDSLLTGHPELIRIIAEDVTRGSEGENFSMGDTRSVEQIMRAALYKGLKGLDYRELEFHRENFRICEQFLQIECRISIYQSDLNLKSLYQKAKLFVFPSFEEGFGIPLIESLKNDCPIACSNVSCIPEVIGNASTCFNPFSVASIANAIVYALSEENLDTLFLM